MDGSDVGKILLVIGAAVLLTGAWLATGHRIPFGSLPGDISFRSGNVSFGFPLVSCLILSVVLTVILNIFLRR